MKTIAFITSEEDPQLINDDRLAFAPLLDLGLEVRPLVWDSDADLTSFDAFIFRSCWNYHRKFDQFISWLDSLEKLRKPVLNAVGVSRWNLNKKYLLELKKKGAVIPETEWIEKRSVIQPAQLASIIKKIPSEKVVIKPAVSLNGQDTYLLVSSELLEIEKVIKELLKERDVLIQEFIPEVKTSGEVSLVFFDGKFSHAIKKIPSREEFRVHSEYGGTRVSVTPSIDIINQAERVLAMIGESLLFCRVDIVEKEGVAILIEAEIIDPMLFLGYSEGAPERFAKAIKKRLPF